MARALVIIAALLAVDLSALSQPFPAGATASTVWDAHGRSVGQIIGVTATQLRQVGWVRIRTSEARSMILPVTRERGGHLTWAKYESPLYFERVDCTGPALAVPAESSLGDSAAIVDSGNQLLLLPDAPGERLILAQSHMTASGCASSGPGTGTLGTFSPATKLLDLDDYFSPPFVISDLRSRSVRP